MNGKRLTGTAKWDDILKPYEVDTCNVYRLLPKMTKRHIKPGAQDVKVSLVVQVMSGAVGAGINTLVRTGKDNSTVTLNDTKAYQQWCYIVQLFV